ncbi:MAG: DUF748 domain-containing protein, partial [Bacteroidota bacterium]
KQTLNSGKTNEGDWLYSVVLRDFNLSAYEYYTEERVFYSKDVELRIRNFNYSLSDSLYFLNADEVGFSLVGSRLFGKGLTLTPNFLASKLATAKTGNFYQVYLPEFSINGVDLYKALLEKEISIGSINIDHLDVKMFLHEAPDPVVKKNRTKVTIATLYTIVQDKLKNVTIGTILLNNASFQFYPRVTEPRPELQVERASLCLNGFHLDSLAHLDTTRILYSKNIEIDLKGFTLALQDKLHDLNAQHVIISTRRSLIDVRNTRLYPSATADPTLRYKSNSFYQMWFPQVRFEQINLFRMFNTRNLEFSRLALFEPDVTIIQYRNRQIPQDTPIRHETFLQKLDLIRNIVIPYMISIHAGAIEISNARISFKDNKQGLNEERISGLADLTLTGFMMDTLTFRDRKEFLNRLELDLKLWDFRYLSQDSLHRIRIGELFANSLSEELDITDFEMYTTSRMDPEMAVPSTMVAKFNTLQVYGFDHRKWMGDRWFFAREIRLEEPSVIIRSVKRMKESSLNEPFEGVDEAVKKIEIGNIRINRGWLDLAEKDKKNRGSLLVRNFDFQLTKFLFDLTGWNQGIKILRYDLLSLKPDQAYPMILDSAYLINFSRFLSDSYPPNLSISDLHITPIKPGNGRKQEPLTVELALPSFTIRQLDLEQVLFNRDLRIREILIAEPDITLHSHPNHTRKKSSGKKPTSSHPELATPFRSMIIENVRLTNGTFHYINERTDRPTQMNLDRINTTIRGFSYDSTHSRKAAATLFFCEDIELQTGRYSMITNDSMNTLSLAGLHLSTGNSTLAIDSFELTPNYSDYEYSRKLGYQTDRMQLSTVNIKMERLDFLTLVEKRKIVAGLVIINGLVLDDYRDKRVEFPTWKRPPMIQEAIRKIVIPLVIDSVALSNGKVTYREQTGEEAGMIFFDRMEVLARNFTSDSLLISRGAELIADGSTYLMGKAKVEGEFRFPLQSPVDTFYFKGKANRMEITLFNPMVTHVTPVKITSGVVDSVNIHWMRGNGIYATGILDLYYHDLQVELLKEKQSFWNWTGTELLQLLVNMAVPQENPGYFNIHRSGYIWNRRDDEKGFFNFFWKSLLSGLKSSEGLNSKEQRAFKEVLKKEMKKK